MSQYRKLKSARCEKDMIIVAYAPNSIISNPNGTFCQVKSVNKNKVNLIVMGTKTGLAIDLSDEAVWAYDPSSTDTPIHAIIKDPAAFPGFTPRMEKEGWNGKVFNYAAEEVVFDSKEESPGYGYHFLRHTGDTKKADGSFYRNLFRMEDISPVAPPEWRQSKAEKMGADVVELPLPPKPVSEADKAIITAITPWLIELNKGLTSENTSHGKCSADFKQHTLYKNTQCHRDVQSSTSYEPAYVFTIGLNRLPVGGWNKGHASKEAMRLWITYLTSYSPYADAFVTKDPDYILKHGYILRGSAPSRIVVGACFATRQLWEKKDRAEGFLELYKAGLSLDEAFLFGCQCSLCDKGKMKFGQEGSGHSHLYNGRLTDDCITAFLDHKPKVKDVPFIVDNKPSGSSGGIDGMWSKSFSRKPRAKIVDKLMDLKRPGAPAFDNALAIEDAVEQAVELISDWRADHYM